MPHQRRRAHDPRVHRGAAPSHRPVWSRDLGFESWRLSQPVSSSSISAHAVRERPAVSGAIEVELGRRTWPGAKGEAFTPPFLCRQFPGSILPNRRSLSGSSSAYSRPRPTWNNRALFSFSVLARSIVRSPAPLRTSVHTENAAGAILIPAMIFILATWISPHADPTRISRTTTTPSVGMAMTVAGRFRARSQAQLSMPFTGQPSSQRKTVGSSSTAIEVSSRLLSIGNSMPIR